LSSAFGTMVGEEWNGDLPQRRLEDLRARHRDSKDEAQ
jgi:hypothetical protein